MYMFDVRMCKMCKCDVFVCETRGTKSSKGRRPKLVPSCSPTTLYMSRLLSIESSRRQTCISQPQRTLLDQNLTCPRSTDVLPANITTARPLLAARDTTAHDHHHFRSHTINATHIHPIDIVLNSSLPTSTYTTINDTTTYHGLPIQPRTVV